MIREPAPPALRRLRAINRARARGDHATADRNLAALLDLDARALGMRAYWDSRRWVSEATLRQLHHPMTPAFYPLPVRMPGGGES